MPTPPKGWPIGSYPTYAEAQRAVDYLSDQAFPVQQVTIVGVDLMQVGEAGWIEQCSLNLALDRSLWADKEAEVKVEKKGFIPLIKIVRSKDGYQVDLNDYTGGPWVPGRYSINKESMLRVSEIIYNPPKEADQK